MTWIGIPARHRDGTNVDISCAKRGENVTICHEEITKLDLTPITESKQLKMVTIIDCFFLRELDLLPIAELENLQYLEIINSFALESLDLSPLSKLSNLQALIIGGNMNKYENQRHGFYWDGINILVHLLRYSRIVFFVYGSASIFKTSSGSTQTCPWAS